MSTFFKRTALIAGAAAAAIAGIAPTAALAQYRSSNQQYDANGYTYDACQRSQTNRAVTGGLVGAGIGLALGNNSGRQRNHDNNAALGAVLGAAAGAVIGGSSAACNSDYAYDSRYNGYNDYGYAPPPPPVRKAPPPQYGYGYGNGYDPYYGQGYGQGYGYNDDRYGPQCQVIEDNIRLPDGRTQRRLVQACRDSNGRYQIVQ